MKEEEAHSGVGEISLGLRTDTWGCFLCSGSRSCDSARGWRWLTGSQAKEAAICTSQVQNTVSTTIVFFFFKFHELIHVSVMIAGRSVCLCFGAPFFSSLKKRESETKNRMLDLLCVQVVATFFLEGRTFFHFVRKSLEYQMIQSILYDKKYVSTHLIKLLLLL